MNAKLKPCHALQGVVVRSLVFGAEAAKYAECGVDVWPRWVLTRSQVTLVVNYDMPTTRDGQPAFETYMHRIGRSGRFGVKGAAFNLVFGSQEEGTLDKISRHFDRQIDDVSHDNDDSFELVLQQAGLMSRDD